MEKLISINNNSIQIKEYNGQRVVTFKDIDKVHNRVEGTARKRFNDNRRHFIDGEDFFKITPSEFRTSIGNMDKRQQTNITLITESGYLLLVKSFTDDLSWTVQRELVNSYFREKQREIENTYFRDYQYVDKTFLKNPIVTITDICYFYRLSYITVYNLIQKELTYGSDYVLLQGYELNEYLQENPNAPKCRNRIYVVYKSGFKKILKLLNIDVAKIPKVMLKDSRKGFVVQEEVKHVMDYIRRELKGIEALTYLVESMDTPENLENYRDILVKRLSMLGHWKIDTNLVELGIHWASTEEFTNIQRFKCGMPY